MTPSYPIDPAPAIDPVKLDRLAEVAIKVGLQLQAGQDLLLTAPVNALDLVRRIVELHGGTVQAASEGPGKGAAFVVRLPAVPAPVETVPAVSDAPAGREHGHVLLVEDSADAREILRMILEQSGYLVTCAEDGPGVVAAGFCS